MRTAIIFGITFAAGAMFFACAKGDEGVATDDGGSGTADDAGEPDATHDGNSSYLSDASPSASDAKADAGEDGSIPPVCVESDAGCATGSPGACADGILHCDGGVAVCEATVTSETCYSGVVSTRNTGICHDGTQTCTGTFGPCVGEVDPAPEENCFDNLDNDCDGLVNNGCPTSITIGTDVDLAARGGGGGGAVSVHCPTGALVTRVDSYFDNGDAKVSGVGIYCATPSLIQGASSYTVTLAANTPAPYQVQVGSASNSEQRTDDCGITGITAMRSLVGNYDTYVEATGSHCGTATMTLNSNNTLSFAFADDTGTGYTGYNPFPGTFERDACASGEVIVGYNLHHGAFLDNIQAVCAPLVVKYSAGTPDP